MSANPEFSRPVRVDTLGNQPRRVEIAADEGERAALARRFSLVSIERLSAEASLSRSGDQISAEGRLSAAVTQGCVATGEPVEESVEEEFRIDFRPHPEVGSPDEEVELSDAEMDVVFYDGSSIDLGEAVAESLALSLDPFPRSPAAEAALEAAGVKSEEEAKAESSPFAALAALKDKLQP
jgi:uncharacterized metal-binding protein YceD (DUF177 family)